MATVVVRRPLRRPAPEMPSGELILEAPPEIPTPGGRQWQQMLMIVPMIAMMASIILISTINSGTSATNPLRYVTFGLFGAAMLGMLLLLFLNGSGPSKREMAVARRRFLRGLSQHRVRVGRTADRQREALTYVHPDPDSLWSFADSYRLWERRRTDEDFGAVRIGVGRQGLATALVPPDTQPLESLEPLSALALRRFITTYTTIDELPLALAITGFSRIHVDGDRDRSVGLVRAMLAQLATLQSPDDLRIAVCVGPEQLPEWEWVKWLPHALHPDRVDALGPLRLVAPAIPILEVMLEGVLADRPRFDPTSAAPTSGPHLVVVLDGGSFAGSDHLVTSTGVEGATVIDLTTVPPRSPDRSTLILSVTEDGTMTSFTADLDAEIELGIADTMTQPCAEGLARQLAPLRLTAGTRGEQPLSSELGLAELLDLGDPFAFDPNDTWLPRPNRDRLRVRFGIKPDGTPVELDLKESAQDGMGPHGLLIGATGSGKSELLRTLVLALAITHPPNTLNFALIDFKGGATFTRLDKLPHTSAVITNLIDELPLVDRMTEALNGELIRRQELLRAAGNFSSLRDYEKARVAGAPLEEVPTLFVICDEFSELLSARPDFIDVFVQIGRVGRSLGVHLLLASQRLEEGRLRGLDTHLSYRIGLRTFSDIDSRVVLGVNDAFTLPRAPGHGFLRYGDEPMVRFRSAYVSGVHLPGELRSGKSSSGEPIGLQEFTTAYVPPPVDEEDVEETEEIDPDEAIGESLMDILVDRFQGKGTPAHQVWLPPLGISPSLDQMLGQVGTIPGRGFGALDQNLHGRLRAVAGVVDRPLDQRRDPLVIDLADAAGHLLVMGAPRTGKSTALRTVITSLALTHTPREVQFYCLDFGGGSLSSIRGLPHVGGVASRQNTGAVRRSVAEVVGVLADREARFAELDVDSMATYRARRANGTIADDDFGDVFLVVDGWPTLRKDFEDLEDLLISVATRGLAYGVHIMASCSRPFDLRPTMRDLFGSRIELRLGDPGDSMIDRPTALKVPEKAPGRGIATTRHELLVALPRLDGGSDPASLPEAVTALVEAVASGWPGESAPEVRMLPGKLPYASLPADEDGGRRFAIGIAEQDLGPAYLDFNVDAHALLFGDSESGKTTFLRTLARRIVAANTPSQARLLVVDHRRGLLGEVGPDHLLGFGSDLTATTQLMADAAAAMKQRLPGPDVTPEQLRSRSWWRGPELYVLVDDYDLVVSPMNNPFAPLLDYLAQGRDIGLHVVMTRRTGGAGRALFEPFMSRLRDVGTPGVLLSGDKDEGPLIGGVKPEVLPPGRGRLIARKGAPQLIQLAWLDPAE
ncbi:type VII secretion protein EccCa [Fodinicola acaciae]|uniref:type VII secretion protein EccCa n=1 Tax=Fodinicola acaciae TaxID=2681555 RepID=UPI0013D50F96|nr:type VII secretion protein EccCa [Fodinicola acaciae]